MIMVLKNPWKVLKYCYRIFEFWGEVGPGRVLLTWWEYEHYREA